MTEFHRDVLGKYSDLTDAGLEMVVAEATARYLASAQFDEELDIEVVPTRLGNTSLTIRLYVRREETIVVEGELRYVFVEARTGSKHPIPDGVRAALDPRLDEAD
jgi:acyl-CoA thioester hydrolase